MLIVILFIIYFLISIPVLIFWQGRGLNIKNMALSVIPATLGVILSIVILVYVLPRDLDDAITFFTASAIIPSVLAAIFIHKYGSKGFSINIFESLLFSKTRNVLFSYLVANIIGLLLASLTIAMFGGWKAMGVVLVATIFIIPVSLFFTIIITCFVVTPSIKLAIICSLVFGTFSFVLVILDQDDWWFTLPTFVYTAVTPFLIIYYLIKTIPENASSENRNSGEKVKNIKAVVSSDQ